MNKSDSERIVAVLEKQGFKLAQKNETPDLILVNVCSVRQAAIDRASAQIKSAKEEFQRKNSKCKIILTGCVLEKDKRELEKYCDAIFNIDKLQKLPQILKNLNFKIKKSEPKTKHYLKATPKHQSPFVVYIPIMTGCNNFCSYCVVPYVRGKEISRPAQDIVCEAKKAVKNGSKELWLLGQNVNSYKCKTHNANPKTKKEKSTDFPALLKMINDIEGNFWIRFTSSHPKDLSDKLIKTMAKCHKVTPYINLPIQSGDNEILKKMNRPYTVSQYKALIKKIRDNFKKYRCGIEKEVAVSSDVIVGFPGETKKQFENTKNNFEKIGFAFGYIAAYSKRPQTAASQLKDNVPNSEKKRREKIMFKILEKTALDFNKRFLNQIVSVLVYKKIKGLYIGKTKHHQTIKLKSDKNILGNFVKAKIINIGPYGLRGKLME